MVDTYVKPAVLERIDPQQFGAVPKSSTTHALISMLHSWLESTDGNGATTRAVLFDFRKAFDLIDHHVLAPKALLVRLSGIDHVLDFGFPDEQKAKGEIEL